MTRTEILEKIKGILLADDFVGIKEGIEDITEETSLLDDLALDSLQILNLVVLLEEKFNFICEEEELNLDMFDDMHHLVSFIEKKTAGE